MLTRRPIILTCDFFPIMNMSGPRKKTRRSDQTVWQPTVGSEAVKVFRKGPTVCLKAPKLYRNPGDRFRPKADIQDLKLSQG